MGKRREIIVGSNHYIEDLYGSTRKSRNQENLVHTGSIHCTNLHISSSISASEIYVDSRRIGGTPLEHFGELYINGTQTTELTLDIWKKAGGTTVSTYLNFFDMSENNRLLHTGSSYIDYFDIRSSVCFYSSIDDTIVDIAIAKNGAIISSSMIGNPLTLTTAYTIITTHNIVSLDNNDYVELWLKADKTVTITMRNYIFSAMRV